MKVKILGGVIVLAVLSIVVYKAASKGQSSRLEGIPHKNQVSWRVEKAKKEGLNRIELEAPTIDYLGAEDSDLNSALQSYSVVVATPVDERVNVQTDTGNDLLTWTKFRITEELSPLRPPVCANCNSYVPPKEMLPLPPGEFLIPKAGGEQTIDGVTVSEVDPGFPAFKSGLNYLLLISLDPNGVAFTLGGPMGVFTVSEGGHLSPVSAKKHPLKDEMKSIYGSSLDHVRAVTKASR